MPRYLGLLVRPFRLEPTPFLCAMGASAEGKVGDADLGVLLPMPGLSAVVLPPLELEHVDLGLFTHADDLGHDLGTGHQWRPGLDGLPVGAQQDFVEGDLGACLSVHERKPDRLAFFGPELLARGPENRVHGCPLAGLGTALARKRRPWMGLTQGVAGHRRLGTGPPHSRSQGKERSGECSTGNALRGMLYGECSTGNALRGMLYGECSTGNALRGMLQTVLRKRRADLCLRSRRQPEHTTALSLVARSAVRPQATAYNSVTSRPAGRLISRNSSSRIIGSSRNSRSSPVSLERVWSSLGSSSRRYRATSGCSRTVSWRSRCSWPARLRARSRRRATTSGVKTRPLPAHVGQSVVIECQRDGRTRCRVISTRPSSETASALVRARSRPRWVLSSCSTLSRLDRVSMSMKSHTMMPPMSRRRIWRAISRAASRLVRRIVFSGSFLPV